jgi:selenide,water dikinase
MKTNGGVSESHMTTDSIRLTQFSPAAGCGCKLSPDILHRILSGVETGTPENTQASLLVGNDSRDDSAAVDIGNGRALLSTTDFFTPIVDDPREFGEIAATNAISDIYAMGGTPTVAIAILGWPVDKLAPEVAREVLSGARAICSKAGITLAGGHSIDISEPIFGLAVSGLVDIDHLRRNDSAIDGDALFLTKPLGVGIISTAGKRARATQQDLALASREHAHVKQNWSRIIVPRRRHGYDRCHRFWAGRSSYRDDAWQRPRRQHRLVSDPHNW